MAKMRWEEFSYYKSVHRGLSKGKEEEFDRNNLRYLLQSEM